LFFAAAVQAQTPAGNRPPGPGAPKGKGGPPLVKEDEYLKLLALPAVQKELELLDDQQAQLRKIEEELRVRIAEVVGQIDPRTAEPEELALLREKIQKNEGEWRAWLQKKVADVLLPHQHERLKQIALQARGMAIVRDPEIAKELRITDEQLAEMDRIQRQVKADGDRIKKQLGDLFKGKEGGELRKEQEAALRKDAEEQIRAVFTREQTRRLERLLGKPFDVAQLKGGGKPKPPKPDVTP
jgi:hypothetical protein